MDSLHTHSDPGQFGDGKTRAKWFAHFRRSAVDEGTKWNHDLPVLLFCGCRNVHTMHTNCGCQLLQLLQRTGKHILLVRIWMGYIHIQAHTLVLCGQSHFLTPFLNADIGAWQEKGLGHWTNLLAQHSTIHEPMMILNWLWCVTSKRWQLYTREGNHLISHTVTLSLQSTMFCLRMCLKVSSTTCVVPEQEWPPSMKMRQVTAVPSCSGTTQVCRGRLKTQSQVEQSTVEWRFCGMAQLNDVHLLWTAASCLWCHTKANWVSS